MNRSITAVLLLWLFAISTSLPESCKAAVGAIDVTQAPYSAVADGVTDDTQAINRALLTGSAIYLPTSKACYKTSAALVMSTPGQIMYGDGRTRSKICPSETPFAYGVIYFRSGEVGPEVRDVGIIFSQPDSNTRKAMIQYEPAIFAQNTPRFRLQGIRISRAWNGVDMTGNSGGALISDLEMSAFNSGIWIDGSLDSVRLDNVHSWPFDLSIKQREVFYDPEATSFYIGRCDDCKIRGGASLAGTAMVFFAGVSGPAFGSVSDFAFDTNSGIRMSAGTIDMSNVYFTLTPSALTRAIYMTGGTLNISSFWALAGPTNVPMIEVLSMDQAGNTSFNMSNGKVELGKQNSTFLSTKNMGGLGHIGLTNIFFDAIPNVSHSNPIISIDRNFRIQAMGNQIRDKGTGDGTFFLVRYDDFHRVVYNSSVGWMNSFPIAVSGIYTPN